MCILTPDFILNPFVIGFRLNPQNSKDQNIQSLVVSNRLKIIYHKKMISVTLLFLRSWDYQRWAVAWLNDVHFQWENVSVISTVSNATLFFVFGSLTFSNILRLPGPLTLIPHWIVSDTMTMCVCPQFNGSLWQHRPLPPTKISFWHITALLSISGWQWQCFCDWRLYRNVRHHFKGV